MSFNNLVTSIVEPILVLFGFKLKQDINGILEYDHNYLTITISYDYNSSYEGDVTVLFKESGLFYGYADLKQYFYDNKSNFSATQIINENSMIKWLEGVDKFFKDNLNNIIQNHKVIQTELERIRQHQIDNYESERNKRLLNEGVKKYWMVKDYSGLVNFLKNKGKLVGSVKKKYEFALKMIKEK
ncbi:hypothetical protein GCM10023091_20680 [Ravibacter arvi]|uniref:Uncharacterized protein n=1 Tax=Ravibacter arvi TaxID=2051041 RepID=A0ABP8LYK5_9BACT